MATEAELRRVLVDRPRWMDQAACKGQTDLFYVEVSGPPPKNASLVCELCPVTRECLGYAIARNERFGVWGADDAMRIRASDCCTRRGTVGP
mgnify:CR=1 FL=1